jgi:hypothetical protein
MRLNASSEKQAWQRAACAPPRPVHSMCEMSPLWAEVLPMWLRAWLQNRLTLFGAGRPTPPTGRAKVSRDNRLRRKRHGQETVPEQGFSPVLKIRLLDAGGKISEALDDRKKMMGPRGLLLSPHVTLADARTSP